MDRMTLGAFKNGRFEPFPIVDKVCIKVEQIRPIRIAPILVIIRAQVMHRLFNRHPSLYQAELDFCDFMSHTIDVNGCWLWTGPASGSGHGVFTPTNSEPMQATHFIMAHAGRPAIEGHRIANDCGQVKCVNPDHLWWMSNRARGKLNALKREAHG